MNNFSQYEDEIIDMIGDILAIEMENGDLHDIDVLNTAVEMCSILGGVNILFDAGIATWRITHREVADKLSEVAQNKGLTLKTIIIDEIIIRVAKILGKIYPPENCSLPISDESQSE